MSYDSGHTERESGVFFDGVAEVVPELEVIHSSAVSVVYRSRIDGRRVALKGLPEDKRHDPAALAALRKEYMMLLELDHSGIVRVFGMREFSGIGHVIVMEYVEGETLAEVEPEYLSVRQRRRILTELIDAVAYIHSKGMVHRDIKLSNVMTARLGGHVKLIDFGFSDSDGWWIGKQPAGTEGYVSDEQRTSRVPDLCNDVYSLGVVMKKLRPGLIYGGVCRRCLGDASRRYDSAATLLSRMRRVRRNFLFSVSLFAATVLALMIMFLLPADKPNKQTGVKPVPQQTEAPKDVPQAEPAKAPTVDSREENVSTERVVKQQNPKNVPEEKQEKTNNNGGMLSKELILAAYAAVDAPFRDQMAKLEAATSAKAIPPFLNTARMASQGESFEKLHAKELSPEMRRNLHEVIKLRMLENEFKWNSTRKIKLEELSGEEM